MRIAILGSVALPVPPPFQGGTEWIAFYQAEGLAKLGHKVILFAARGSKKGDYRLIEVGGGDTVVGSGLTAGPVTRISQVSVQVVPTSVGTLPSVNLDSGSPYSRHPLFSPFTESSRKLRLENVYLAQVIGKLIEMKDEYDLILNNMRGEAVFLPFAKSDLVQGKPFINVMHLPLFPELVKLFRVYQTHIITISNAQRKEFPGLNYLATVYNCVDTNKFTFGSGKGSDLKGIQGLTPGNTDDYLLMMGSISPHKNQAGAIRIAKRLGMKLVLAGKIGDMDYYKELQKDIDGKQICWKGELNFEEKLKLYQGALAFLFPILWEEPFGLVMIEAMSCGTPVVAFRNGAIPEVVVNGKTGFVIENNSEDQMIDAVRKIDTIKRADCRRHVENNFTVDIMVDAYDKALTKLI